MDRTASLAGVSAPVSNVTRAGRAKRIALHRLGAVAAALGLAAAAAVPTPALAQAQCTTVLTGLREPVGSILTDRGNLLVAEAGDGTVDSGRISIVDRHGNRRNLLDGLPSGPADVGTPSGPSGMFMQGRSLYLAMGTGDTGIMGPRPGTTLVNPNGPSSPLFSSVLALYFSAGTEYQTTGFTMTQADQQALAAGRFVWLWDSRGNLMFIHMLTNFPDYVATPIPGIPDNISLSNPFDIVGLRGSFYVTDGGRNLTWKVRALSGAQSEFASFPSIPNPLFPNVGGPFIQAVPTGITESRGKLLVSVFRGAPFATGVSTVEQLDPASGNHAPLISNLTTAIDTIPLHGRHQPLLVLEMAASGPFFSGPGTVLQFDDPAATPTTVAACLAAPTSMTLDGRTHTLYVTEEEGNLVSIPFGTN